MSRDPLAGFSGLATDPLDVQRDRVLGAWSGFLDAVAGTDLSAPSRLPGWTGHDVAVHIGDWDEATTLDRLVAQARSGTVVPPWDPDAVNARVVAAHRDASRADVLAALERSRQGVAAWFDSSGPAELGRVTVMSVVGPLPLLTVVNAGAYELAVHALDLVAGPAASGPDRAAGSSAASLGRLLDAGLAALVDVTGVFAYRRGLRTALTAWTGDRGWHVRTDATGWRTTPVTARPPGAVAEASAAVLLDASAGRRSVPSLLASRTLKVHSLPDIIRLASIVDEIPGLPGGPALRAAARWVGSTGRLLRLGR
ncbi:MAG TPA: maleylpyruvate isomerase N-terminal domain-containing protein [Mycobacteriales bacterium]